MTLVSFDYDGILTDTLDDLIRFGQEAVFMIGDSLSDVRAVKEAGVASVAAIWGYPSLETLLRGNPDAVVHSPPDLIEVIEG